MEIEKIYKKAKVYGIPVIKTESHKLLSTLVKKYKPKHVLEIGTAVGYSGITILSATDGDLVTIEHNKDFIKQAKKNFADYNFSNRVTIVNGDCLVELARMVNNPSYKGYFDFVFLDGPKAQYDSMFEGLLYLLGDNGVFLADNVLFRGYTSGEIKAPTRRYKTIIKRLNQFIENCKNNPNLTKFELINIEDGLIFAKKVQNEK